MGQEDPLVEGMATHSSILAWKVSMDRGAWGLGSVDHRVAQSQTRLKRQYACTHSRGMVTSSVFWLWSSLYRTSSHAQIETKVCLNILVVTLLVPKILFCIPWHGVPGITMSCWWYCCIPLEYFCAHQASQLFLWALPLMSGGLKGQIMQEINGILWTPAFSLCTLWFDNH